MSQDLGTKDQPSPYLQVPVEQHSKNSKNFNLEPEFLGYYNSVFTEVGG